MDWRGLSSGREIACMSTSMDNLLPRFPREKLGRRLVKWEEWQVLPRLPNNKAVSPLDQPFMLCWEIRLSEELTEKDWELVQTQQSGLTPENMNAKFLELVTPPNASVPGDVGRIARYPFRTHLVKVWFLESRWNEAVAYLSAKIADGSIMDGAFEPNRKADICYYLPLEIAEEAER